MEIYKKIICSSLLSFVVNICYANASVFPKGCEVTGFGFSNDFLVLNETGNQSYFLIQNRSNKKIEFEHYDTTPDVFMSPKLESKLLPGNWSAFASDIDNTYFNCFTYENNERVTINCSEILDVCQYPRVKFALSNMGTYWVSTNKPQSQVIRDSIKKGIFLHW
ncbi:MAG: enhanced entry protein EnhB [Legionellales bacterium RIFCSPHIGHO2_12_FULL_35_11]|nr:MAG: enhanced entry protein EnhB [Legionellales bacterium RIFCSPHIGHO2_12_FULL_35_11]